MHKATLPKGTRDFSPIELKKRSKIIEVIEKNFELFGFSPIQTPSFENLSTLMHKYGKEEEGLIFKILNSGDFLKAIKDRLYKVSESEKAQREGLFKEEINIEKCLPLLSTKALRYDLTVPFARYVAMHKHELCFPFKRYQIQPVWRADNPQKGRYREFYQCDGDVIGSDSIWQEFEFIKLYDIIFTELGLKVVIELNHRVLLELLAKKAKIENWKDFIILLDKWNKIGKEAVYKEMLKRNISAESIKQIDTFLDFNTLSFKEKLEKITTYLGSYKESEQLLKELYFLDDKLKEFPLNSASLNLNFTLARGLSYYTGLIFEVTLNNNALSLPSIGGGGRYGKLAEDFGLKDLSGVGISFGLDRIYLAMEQLGLFSKWAYFKQVLFVNFGEEQANFSFKWIEALRKEGIQSEFYPSAVKIKKQFEYALKNHIRFVALASEQEINQNRIRLKELSTSHESFYESPMELASFIKKQQQQEAIL